MSGKIENRHALISLVDEVSRLSGRLKSVFAESRRTVGLGDSELMVLNAVVEAERPPTASQIGRSLGFPRQLVQRAANALLTDRLIEGRLNPDHKRAPLLVPTKAGIARKRAVDELADRIAKGLSDGLDEVAIRKTAKRLGKLRVQLEEHLRDRED